jgi:GT2 family glycosyltransferase
MVDDDAVPQPGWFVALVKPFEESGDVVGVEGRVVPSGEDFGPLGMSPVNQEGGVFLTCNIAYRHDVLLKIGGFDEGFPFPAFEDTDLAAAAAQHGRIMWAPDAEVHHPRRRWTLQRALREIRFNRALLRYARRYNAMGWEGRPTHFPVARTVWSAVVTLPAGRVLNGLKSISRYPAESAEYIGIAAAQGLAASVLIWPEVLKAGRGPVPPRQSSLLANAASTSPAPTT